jgi:hypothetical protein
MNNTKVKNKVKNKKLDHEHFDKFYYCPICMQYQYPKNDKVRNL